MDVQQKLYSLEEVKALVHSSCTELLTKYKDDSNTWGMELLPSLQKAIALEIKDRHQNGVSFAIWAGPPGSGKGTNIETVSYIGQLYKECCDENRCSALAEPYNETLLTMSRKTGFIVTGTKGIAHDPLGEYAELFAAVQPIFKAEVAKGKFVGDGLISALVLFMVLYRLVEGFDRLQLDLWPRTTKQFALYREFLSYIEREGGKAISEIVSFRLLPDVECDQIRTQPTAFAEASYRMGERLVELLKRIDTDFPSDDSEAPQERFDREAGVLKKILADLATEFPDDISLVVEQEIRLIVERLAFRFRKTLEVGETPRDDEYPLRIAHRLTVYLKETSPAFLTALADDKLGESVLLVSTVYDPATVSQKLLNELAGSSGISEVNDQWNAITQLAGTIATKIVAKERLIAGIDKQTLEGILRP